MNKKKIMVPPLFIELLLPILSASAAFWLRYSSLQLINLDIDEAFQLFIVSRSNLRELLAAIYSLGPQQYPLDYILGFIATRFTKDIGLLRLLPLMWGVGSVVCVYGLGKLFLNKLFAGTSAWLLAISLFHIHYSQTFRAYSLIVFLSLLSMFFFLKAAKNGKYFLPYAVTTILFQSIYPFSFCKTLAECWYVWYLKVPHRRKFFIVLFVSGFIPLTLFWIHSRELIQDHSFFYDAPRFFRDRMAVDLIMQFSQGSMLAAVFYGLCALLGVCAGLRSQQWRLLTTLMLMISLCIFGTLFLTIKLTHLFFVPRHIIVILPIYLAFVGAGFAALAHGFKFVLGKSSLPLEKYAAVFLCALALMMLLRPLKIYLERETAVAHYQSHSAVFLKIAMAPNDSVIYSNPNLGATMLYYLDADAFFRLEGVYLYQGFNLFRFPRNHQSVIGSSRHEVYTLCGLDKASATMDRTRFEELLNKNKSSRGRVWCVYSDMNYIPEPNPFYAVLGLKPDQLELKYPGIFLLKM